MKVVILDDLNTDPPTPAQIEKLKRWFNRMESIFPRGHVQIYHVPYQKDDLRKALGL